MNRLQQAVQANGGKTLLGAAAYFYDPIFLEICAHLGYQVIWIEMEHGHITFAEAADLCRMAAGSGMLTMIRIPDVRRENVLKGAECGPDILDVPMIETPEQMLDLREYARFAPAGQPRHVLRFARRQLRHPRRRRGKAAESSTTPSALWRKSKASAALDRVDELAAVPDVDLFIGPADLAASLGLPSQTSHPTVQAAATKIVKAARNHNKSVATACAPDEFAFWLGLGIDLLFCTNDISCLKQAAGDFLSDARTILESLNGQLVPPVS